MTLTWLKWASTILLILGAIASALNLFPLNVALALLGNFGWFLAGIKMKEPSLWVLSLLLVGIYFFGVINGVHVI